MNILSDSQNIKNYIIEKYENALKIIDNANEVLLQINTKDIKSQVYSDDFFKFLAKKYGNKDDPFLKRLPFSNLLHNRVATRNYFNFSPKGGGISNFQQLGYETIPLLNELIDYAEENPNKVKPDLIPILSNSVLELNKVLSKSQEEQEIIKTFNANIFNSNKITTLDSREIKDTINKKIGEIQDYIVIANRKLAEIESLRSEIIDKYNSEEGGRYKLNENASPEEIFRVVQATNNVSLKNKGYDLALQLENRLLTFSEIGVKNPRNDPFVKNLYYYTSQIRQFEKAMGLNPAPLNGLKLTGYSPSVGYVEKYNEVKNQRLEPKRIEKDSSAIQGKIDEDTFGKRAKIVAAKEAEKSSPDKKWKTFYEYFEYSPDSSKKFDDYLKEFYGNIERNRYDEVNNAIAKIEKSGNIEEIAIAKAARKRAFERNWQNKKGAGVYVLEKSALEGADDAPMIPYIPEIMEEEDCLNEVGFIDIEKINSNPELKEKVETRIRRKMYAHEITYRVAQELSTTIVNISKHSDRIANKKVKDLNDSTKEISVVDLIARTATERIADDASKYFDLQVKANGGSLIDARNALLEYLHQRVETHDVTSELKKEISASINLVLNEHIPELFTQKNDNQLSIAEKDKIVSEIVDDAAVSALITIRASDNKVAPQSKIEVRIPEPNKDADENDTILEIKETTLANLPYASQITQLGMNDKPNVGLNSSPLSKTNKSDTGIVECSKTTEFIQVPTTEKLVEPYQRIGLAKEESEVSEEYGKAKFIDEANYRKQMALNRSFAHDFDNQLISSLFRGQLLAYLDKQREDAKEEFAFEILSNIIGRYAGYDVQRVFNLHKTTGLVGDIFQHPQALAHVMWDKGYFLPKTKDGRIVGIRGRLSNLITRSIGLRKQKDIGGGQTRDVNLITYGARTKITGGLDRIAKTRVAKAFGLDKTLSYENRSHKHSALELVISVIVRAAFTTFKNIIKIGVQVGKDVGAVTSKGYKNLAGTSLGKTLGLNPDLFTNARNNISNGFTASLGQVTRNDLVVNATKLKDFSKVGGVFTSASIRSIQSGFFGSLIGGLVAGPAGAVVGGFIFGGNAFIRTLVESGNLERAVNKYLGAVSEFDYKVSRVVIKNGLTNTDLVTKLKVTPANILQYEGTIPGYSFTSIQADEIVESLQKSLKPGYGLRVVFTSPPKFRFYLNSGDLNSPISRIEVAMNDVINKETGEIVGKAADYGEFKIVKLSELQRWKAETGILSKSLVYLSDHFQSLFSLEGAVGRAMRYLNIWAKGRYPTLIELSKGKGVGKIGNSILKNINEVNIQVTDIDRSINRYVTKPVGVFTPSGINNVFSALKSGFNYGMLAFILTGGNPFAAIGVILGKTVLDLTIKNQIQASFLNIKTTISGAVQRSSIGKAASAVNNAITKIVRLPLMEALGLGAGAYTVWETVDEILYNMKQGQTLFQAIGNVVFSNPFRSLTNGVNLYFYAKSAQAFGGILTRTFFPAAGSVASAEFAAKGITTAGFARNISFASITGSLFGSFLGGLIFGFTPSVMIVSGMVGGVVGAITGAVATLITANPLIGFGVGTAAGTFFGGLAGYFGRALDSVAELFGRGIQLIGGLLGLKRFFDAKTLMQRAEAAMGIAMSLSVGGAIVGVGLVVFPTIFTPGLLLPVSRIANVQKSYVKLPVNVTNGTDPITELSYTINISKGIVPENVDNIVIDFQDVLSDNTNISQILLTKQIAGTSLANNVISFKHSTTRAAFKDLGQIAYTVKLNKNLRDHLTGGQYLCNKISGSVKAVQTVDKVNKDITESIDQSICIDRNGKIVNSTAQGSQFIDFLGTFPLDPKANGVRVTQCSYSEGSHEKNLALDVGAPLGTPLVALAAGKVWDVDIYSQNDRNAGYGTKVDILLDPINGQQYMIRYAHMLPTVNVRVGDKVTEKQVIGYVGSTGNSTGPHLHFETTIIPTGFGSVGAQVDPCCVISCKEFTPSIKNGKDCTNPLSSYYFDPRVKCTKGNFLK